MESLINVLKSILGGNKTTNTNTNNVHVVTHVEVPTVQPISTTSVNAADIEKIAGYKETAKILFIDDTSQKDKIKNLKKAGWKHIEQISDVHNIDSLEIRESEIIFVDFKGIGEKESEQGLGVLSALKVRYDETKWLILFTAYEVPITAFQKGANDYLAKNSSKYETEQKIIKGLQHLRK